MVGTPTTGLPHEISRTPAAFRQGRDQDLPRNPFASRFSVPKSQRSPPQRRPRLSGALVRPQWKTRHPTAPSWWMMRGAPGLISAVPGASAGSPSSSASDAARVGRCRPGEETSRVNLGAQSSGPRVPAQGQADRMIPVRKDEAVMSNANKKSILIWSCEYHRMVYVVGSRSRGLWDVDEEIWGRR